MNVKQLIPSLVLPIAGQITDKVRESGSSAFGRGEHEDFISTDLMQVADFYRLDASLSSSSTNPVGFTKSVKIRLDAV